jgi:hypothetical protein
MTGPDYQKTWIDEIGDYGGVAKADYREVWLHVCRDELDAADGRRRQAELDAAVGRHPSQGVLDDEPPPRPTETVDVDGDVL